MNTEQEFYLYVLIDAAHEKFKVGITEHINARPIKVTRDFGPTDKHNSFYIQGTKQDMVDLERTILFMFKRWFYEVDDKYPGYSEWLYYGCLDLVKDEIDTINRPFTYGINKIETRCSQKKSQLAKYLFKEYRYRILKLLSDKTGELYANEIIRHVDGGVGGTQRELCMMVESGVVIKRRCGNRTMYKLNQDCDIYEELISIMAKI